MHKPWNGVSYRYARLSPNTPDATTCESFRLRFYAQPGVHTHTPFVQQPADCSWRDRSGQGCAGPAPQPNSQRRGGHGAGSAPGHRGTARTDPPGCSAQGGGGGSVGEPVRRSPSAPPASPGEAVLHCGHSPPLLFPGPPCCPGAAAIPLLVRLPARRVGPAAPEEGARERPPPRRGKRGRGGGCREAALAGGKALRFYGYLEEVLRGSG